MPIVKIQTGGRSEVQTVDISPVNQVSVVDNDISDIQIFSGIKGEKGDKGDKGDTGDNGETGAPGDLSTSSVVFGETPIGALNGINKTFGSEFSFATGKIAVYLNGLLQSKEHYSVSGSNQIILDDAPMSTDELTISYIKL